MSREIKKKKERQRKMETNRSFSTSTLTMKDSRSRPSYLGERRHSRGMRQQQDPVGKAGRRSSLSDIYKNPQIYAALRQNSSEQKWSLARKCLLLTPAFSLQFCTVLTSVFSTVNMILLKTPFPLRSAHLFIAGIGSVILIVTFQKLVQKFYGERKRITLIFVGYVVCLLIGLTMVLLVNVQRIISAENDSWLNVTDIAHISTTAFSMTEELISYQSSSAHDVIKKHDFSLVNATLSPHITGPTTVPLYLHILAFIGYIIVASSLSSGQYLLLSSATSLTNTNDHDAIITIATAASAVGGCALCFLGGVDLSSDWYPSQESKYHVYGQIFILSCIAIVLTIGCASCAVVTWYMDVISDMPCLCRNSEPDTPMNRERRPTRTAQEMFDECAPLLGGRNDGFTSTIDEHSVSHGDNNDVTSFTTSQSGTVMEESIFRNRPDLIKPYPYNLPTTTATGLIKSRSWLTKLKSRKNFILALLLVFFMSNAWVSLEYNSSVFLSYAAYEADDEAGGSFKKGARIGSAGIFLIYLLFLAVYFFYERIPQQTGWKRLALGVSVVASLLTLALAVSDSIAAYFTVTCVHGLLRVVVVSLPRLLTAQTVRSEIGFQPSTVRQILIETPTTAIWCMTPLSLVTSSLIIPPLTEVLGCHGVPMYYSAASAILSCVILIVLL